MRVAVGAVTDVGRVRSNNEDSFVTEGPLFAVADGMGGGNAGEVASALALQTLGRISKELGSVDLAEWVRKANRAVFDRSISDRSTSGMGTTLTAVLAEGEHLRLAHVGDSRAYLLRQGRLQRLTEDHTRVARMVRDGTITEEQAAQHPERNIITRALGIADDVKVDQTLVEVRTGDRLLLCTDGLTGMVNEGTLKEVLASTPDPQEAARRLVEAANQAGGVDNVTAVVLDVEAVEAPASALPDRPPPGDRREPRRVGRAPAAALALVALLATGLVLRQTDSWPFSKSASSTSPAPAASAETPAVTPTPTSAPTPSPTPSCDLQGIADALRPGTVCVSSATADLNGDGREEIVVLAQAEPGQGASSTAATYLDVYRIEANGVATNVFDATRQSPIVDQNTGSAGPTPSASPPKPMIAAASDQQAVFYLIDFRQDGISQIVVGVLMDESLDVWVISSTKDFKFQADFFQVLDQGGELTAQGSTLEVTPSVGTPETIGYDPVTRRIGVLSP